METLETWEHGNTPAVLAVLSAAPAVRFGNRWQSHSAQVGRRWKPYVRISDCCFNTDDLDRRGNLLGNSGVSTNIWECNTVAKTRPRD